MDRAPDLKTVSRIGRTFRGDPWLSPRHRSLWMAFSQITATAEDDVLQQAINYVFTGTIDPKDGPEITDRKSCAVVVPDENGKNRSDIICLGWGSTIPASTARIPDGRLATNSTPKAIKPSRSF